MSLNTEKYYESRFKFDKNRTKVWKAINEYLQKHIKDNSYILDLGCGYCDFINGIKGEKKYAIDLNEEMQNYCKKNILFQAQSVLDEFNLEDNSLDVVFASNLFEHFNDHELDMLIYNISRKLKNEGILILIQPNIYYAYREYWDDYTHKKAFSHESLADFLKSNEFQIVKKQKKFIPFSLKSRLPKSYILTKLYLNSPFKPFAKQMLIIAKRTIKNEK
jgi:SAM-dependent methyltransferase